MKEQKRLFLVNAAIIVATIAAMSFVCIFFGAKSMKAAHSVGNAAVTNTAGSGSTPLDASTRVELYCISQLSEMNVNLTYNGKVYVYSVADLGGTVDAEDMIAHSDDIIKIIDGQSDMAFADIKLKINVDREKLANCIDEIAAEQDIPMRETTAEMDKVTRSFTYKEGSAGKLIDRDSCVDSIEKMILSGDFSSFELVSYEQQPITVQELRNNTKLISSCKTYTSANYNRNTNINLMCEYVNGYTIMPGDVLSINGLVGERTPEKGFMEAGAIIDGKLADEVGGGICQLSGTLYNAALMADMEIVERLPHTWPSDYLEPGLDSTLTMEGAVQKDLKIRNTTDHPMYIAAWLENKNLGSANVLHVEIYGEPLPKGMTIKLRTEILETIQPQSAEVVYVSSLSSGQRHVVKQAKIGYRIRSWRDFYFDGELIDSVPIDVSYYPPIRGKIEVGKGSGSSSSTQTSTPEPDPVETPYYDPEETDSTYTDTEPSPTSTPQNDD